MFGEKRPISSRNINMDMRYLSRNIERYKMRFSIAYNTFKESDIYEPCHFLFCISLTFLVLFCISLINYGLGYLGYLPCLKNKNISDDCGSIPFGIVYTCIELSFLSILTIFSIVLYSIYKGTEEHISEGFSKYSSPASFIVYFIIYGIFSFLLYRFYIKNIFIEKGNSEDDVFALYLLFTYIISPIFFLVLFGCCYGCIPPIYNTVKKMRRNIHDFDITIQNKRG